MLWNLAPSFVHAFYFFNRIVPYSLHPLVCYTSQRCIGVINWAVQLVTEAHRYFYTPCVSHTLCYSYVVGLIEQLLSLMLLFILTLRTLYTSSPTLLVASASLRFIIFYFVIFTLALNFNILIILSAARSSLENWFVNNDTMITIHGKHERWVA